jgi:hypothetical protein
MFSSQIKLFDFEQFFQLGLVVPDYDLTVDFDYWNAELAGFIHHVFSGLLIGGDIKFLKLDVVIVEHLLCLPAVYAGRGRINFYIFCHIFNYTP